MRDVVQYHGDALSHVVSVLQRRKRQRQRDLAPPRQLRAQLQRMIHIMLFDVIQMVFDFQRGVLHHLRDIKAHRHLGRQIENLARGAIKGVHEIIRVDSDDAAAD